jgi:glutamine synthetase
MHVHMSVWDAEGKTALFPNPDGSDSEMFRNFLGGLHKYLPAAMPMLAPTVNSYRRFNPNSDAPINAEWAPDTRLTGLRVPYDKPEGRRVENRIPGADANPYLAIAASLACGYLGMVEGIQPPPPAVADWNAPRKHTLPRHMFDGLALLENASSLRKVVGERFCELLAEVRRIEFFAYQQVISAWEREHLLLNV